MVANKPRRPIAVTRKGRSEAKDSPRRHADGRNIRADVGAPWRVDGDWSAWRRENCDHNLRASYEHAWKTESRFPLDACSFLAFPGVSLIVFFYSQIEKGGLRVTMSFLRHHKRGPVTALQMRLQG
jgi:hypothetical protein